MEQTDRGQIDLNLTGSISGNSSDKILSEVVSLNTTDSQVTVGSLPKRKFTAQYKQQILNAYNACSNSLERGALLRRESLYSSHITSWRQLFSPENDIQKGKNKAQRTEQLLAEIDQLKKRLAQAQAIIDLQKKVSELLGTYILPHESRGGRS